VYVVTTGGGDENEDTGEGEQNSRAHFGEEEKKERMDKRKKAIGSILRSSRGTV